jgi:cell wall assembly regulator SMI1
MNGLVYFAPEWLSLELEQAGNGLTLNYIPRISFNVEPYFYS